MYSSENAVLGTAVVSAPTAFGLLLWPDFALVVVGGSMAVIGGLFLVFKIRNRKHT